jgi:predicted anti-sigma-YlaC factor YlaD
MMLNPEMLKKMLLILTNTHAGEGPLSCDECYEEIDHFAEIELVGMSAADAMPLVQDHLDKCPDCRDEYEALMAALKFMEEEKSADKE